MLQTRLPHCDLNTGWSYPLPRVMLGHAPTYPDEGRGEPSTVLLDAAVPPDVIGHVQDLNDISHPEAELIVLHGNTIPHHICIHQGRQYHTV